MSHVSPIECEVRDLDALALAAARLGGALDRERKAFRYYAGAMEACDAVLTFPGCTYEVGVKQTGVAGVYALAWDDYETAIRLRLGEGAGLLVQAYGIEKAKAELVAEGWTVSEVAHANGDLELVAAEW